VLHMVLPEATLKTYPFGKELILFSRFSSPTTGVRVTESNRVPSYWYKML